MDVVVSMDLSGFLWHVFSVLLNSFTIEFCIVIVKCLRSISLRPSPITLYPSPWPMYPSPCAHHPAPITLRPSPCAHHPAPITLCPSSCAHYPVPSACAISLRPPPSLHHPSLFIVCYFAANLCFVYVIHFLGSMGIILFGRGFFLSSAQRANVILLKCALCD